MLLFKPRHQEPIITGTKTQTRRIWKKPHAKVGAIHLAKTKMISKEFFAKLLITDVYTERLGDISLEDAIAEGYPDKNSYLFAFADINKQSVTDRDFLDQVLYVVKFEVTP
jgi:hypothetical protein